MQEEGSGQPPPGQSALRPQEEQSLAHPSHVLPAVPVLLQVLGRSVHPPSEAPAAEGLTSQSVGRSFSTRFPHSLFTDSFRFLKTLKNGKTDDRRQIIEFYIETSNRLENGEEMVETGKESGISKAQNVVGGTGRGAKTTVNESAEEEEKQKGEKNPEGRLPPDPAEAPLTTELEGERLPKAAAAAASNAAAEAPEEALGVSDMVPFSLDSPGGTCVASLSLMSLGMLNVHLSIPKHIVVVDSNLVDTDTVKR